MDKQRRAAQGAAANTTNNSVPPPRRPSHGQGGSQPAQRQGEQVQHAWGAREAAREPHSPCHTCQRPKHGQATSRKMPQAVWCTSTARTTRPAIPSRSRLRTAHDADDIPRISNPQQLLTCEHRARGANVHPVGSQKRAPRTPSPTRGVRVRRVLETYRFRITRDATIDTPGSSKSTPQAPAGVQQGYPKGPNGPLESGRWPAGELGRQC